MVLLTFGLLSPNKGIENVLDALPQIVEEFPDVVYIVLGATPSERIAGSGEAYRLSLEILAKKNQVDRHVIFYNQFVDIENLQEPIGAADLIHHSLPLMRRKLHRARSPMRLAPVKR